MNRRCVRIVAPSRLHFGMLSVHRFGGVGAMVALPALHITIRPAQRLECAGRLAPRIRKIAAQIAACDAGLGAGSELRCRIEVVGAPRQHVGLGSGTQLAMAIAAGLNALAGRPPLDAAQLARLAGRGERSAIGLHGFVHGGLLFEEGKTAAEEISPLAGRVAMPEAWRFVLLCPRSAEGLSGRLERRAFARLPEAPAEWTDRLRRLARETLLPAAEAGRFEEFSEALYCYGYLAGLSFAAIQGGPFANPRLASLVQWIRGQGIRGVGQSSWGPLLFALTPDESAARDLIAELERRSDRADLDIQVSPANNRGAEIQVSEAEGRS